MHGNACILSLDGTQPDQVLTPLSGYTLDVQIDWINGNINVRYTVQDLIGKGIVLTEPKTEKG